MPKKILILSASPRKGGNSDLLCDQFAKGAGEAGHQVEKIRVQEKKIAPCLACYGCRGTGVCVQKDDMAAILDKFPKLRVCAAHLGGFRQRKYALDVLADRNVWMDTSSCM